MGGIKNKLNNKLSNKLIKGSLSLKEEKRPAAFRVGAPLAGRRCDDMQMSVAHRWGRYTKYLSIACLSLAILSTLILNIVSSYSSSKIKSNAIDSNSEVSTLANNSSSISLSFSNATGSCTDTSNPANVCMSIPDGGGIATGGHTVTVNAGNGIASYGLKLSSKTEETALVNEDKGSNATTIEPITKTYTSVQDLDGFKNVLLSYASDNTWAYFVISEGTSSFGFVSPMTPASKPKTILDSSATTNTNNSINIYYGARVDHPSTMLAGNYTTQVVYTVTATLHEPTIASIDPSTYELASNEGLDSSNRLPVTITGNYLSSTSRVYLTNSNTTASNAGTEYGCTNIQVASDGNSLTCTLPTDKTNSDLEAGTYNLAVLAGNGTAVLDNAFTYTKPSICRNGDPDSDCQVDIDDNMFPVTYVGYNDNSGGYWQIVDGDTMKNTPGSWYDYGQKKWANAITLRDDESGGVVCIGTTIASLRKSSQDCSGQSYTPLEFAKSVASGDDNLTQWSTNTLMLFDEISQEQGYGGIILGYWVYIPRYAYQVQRKEVRDHYVSDALASSNGGFNIRFETASDFKKEPAETCSTDSNNMFYTDMTGMENEPDYVGSCHTRTDYPTREEDYNQTAWATHPAFSWLDSNGDGPELNGFWIGKFETTGSTEQPTVLPNEKHLSAADNGIGDYYDIAQSIGAEDKNNVYGNSSQTSYNNGKGYHSLNTTTSHMLKNSEWGAAAYLSASRYGAGVNGVQINANTSSGVDSNNGPSYGVTGYGPNGSSAYYTDNGQLASTTNNIYGVYDMAGGAWEYVMGSSSSNIFQSITNIYLSIAVKPPYTDLYAYSPFNGDRFTNNNLCTWATCGGHALYETKNVQSIPANGDRASWNSDYSEFVHAGTWFARGGHAADNFRAGTFASSNDNGHVYNLLGFRVALLPNMNSGGSTVPSEIAVTDVDPANISIAKLAMGDPVYFYLNGNNLTKLSRVVLTGVQYPDLTQELSCHADSDTRAECYIRQWDGSNGYPAQDYSATFYGYNDEILYTMDVFVSVTGQMG